MNAAQSIPTRTVRLSDFAAELANVPVFAQLSFADLESLGDVELLEVPAETVLFDPTAPARAYCVMLQGRAVADRVESDGSITRIGKARTGDCFGEVVLLSGKQPHVKVVATEPSRILRFPEQAFWHLMDCCPQVRQLILANMAQRLHTYQAEIAHREKLIALGTLAAGLMHELNNPGTAAKRAASQLRENLARLQMLSLRFCDRENTPTQMACMRELQQDAIAHAKSAALSTLEQADAEETMADWLADSGVENAYRIAPSLVAMGLDPSELNCMKYEFAADGLSDALNWLESLVSSISLVGAIEESISRVSELVMAVKKFAYDDRCGLRQVDVHDSIQSTVTLLGHKFKVKPVELVKDFAATSPLLHSSGVALSQVWTNLLDNAIDAAPAGSTIQVRTWSEPGTLCVSVTDHGAGIPADLQAKIFEPFFTTKPVGEGTGLGLEIVHRIVTQNFGGTIDITSTPGQTTFTVRLPQPPEASTAPAPAGCPS